MKGKKNIIKLLRSWPYESYPQKMQKGAGDSKYLSDAMYIHRKTYAKNIIFNNPHLFFLNIFFINNLIECTCDLLFDRPTAKYTVNGQL